jgi:hypothetical protein
MRVHRKRERKLRLDQRKKQEVLKRTGRLECETCAFEFALAYGEWAEGPRVNNLRKTQTQGTKTPSRPRNACATRESCCFLCSFARDQPGHALPRFAKLGMPRTHSELLSTPLRTVS